MKKKIKFGGLKIKISWKNSRLLKSIVEFFNPPGFGYTLPPEKKIDPEILRERKIYRIFKEDFVEFCNGNKYGSQPSSFLYYKGSFDGSVQRFLIGEFMFGENKEDFFKRKDIVISEKLNDYVISQKDIILAKYSKDWIEKQNQYIR